MNGSTIVPSELEGPFTESAAQRGRSFRRKQMLHC
jgi:hypothetical protein